MKTSHVINVVFTLALSLLGVSASFGQSTALNAALPVAPAGAQNAADSAIDIMIPPTIAMNPGETFLYYLRLANPAPPEGILVSLASSDSTKATVNYNSLFIDPGQTTPFRQPSLYGIAQGSATITATANGLNSATTVVLLGSSMALSPSSLQITGANGTMTLTLSAPAASSLNVSLASSNAGVAAVPASLIIAVGTSAISFNVTAVGGGNSTITATAPGYPPAMASVVSAVVSNSFSISTSSLPGGTVGSNYNAAVVASGGAAPYSWSASGLPGGLSIASGTGIISGVPTAAGSSTLAIKVTDANGLTAQANLALLVNAESSGSGSIAVSSGGVQSANANTTFANPLTVIVKDASNNPLSGATVTFKVPAIGASATLSSGTAITNSSGIARINATANATVGGPYIVSATIAGVATAATFLLSNTGLSATMTPSSLTIVSPVSPPGALILQIDPQAAQVVFALTSSNPAVATVPSSITFPVGTTIQRFTVTGVSAGAIGITARASGYQTVATNVTVNPDLIEGRFLEQAAFGPTPGEIARVQSLGINGWLNSQFAMPETPIPVPSLTAGWPRVQSETLSRITNAPDQLRQKMAWALGQVLVISMDKNNYPDQYVPYQQILSRNAFGNYRTLLSDIARSPQMGKYLDMANSNKPVEGDRLADGTIAVASGANENFPRELMQLFTIGLNQLNMDGTTKLVNGQPAPTYTQTDVVQIALALTGWTFPTAPGASPRLNNPENFSSPVMETRFANHDTSQKSFVGCTLPARQTPESDLDGVIDCLFNHPNMGPFLATRCIRGLVTSNPSPAFIERVATVFNNNGGGVRGDLKAVLRAILTDYEARLDTATINSGRLKDPIYTVVSFTRMMGGSISPDTNISWIFSTMGQSLAFPPSVFGYYSPSYRLPINPALFGPEFQIYSQSESVEMANTLFNTIRYQPNGDPVLDLSPFMEAARYTPQLLDFVDQKFFYGRMPAAMRNSLTTAIDSSYDDMQRVQTALYLAVLSGYYQVQF